MSSQLIYCTCNAPGRKVLHRIRSRIPQEYALKLLRAIQKAGYSATLIMPSDIESSAPVDILAWHEELVYQLYVQDILDPK